MQTIYEMMWFDWHRAEHVAFAVFAAVVIVVMVALLVRDVNR